MCRQNLGKKKKKVRKRKNCFIIFIRAIELENVLIFDSIDKWQSIRERRYARTAYIRARVPQGFRLRLVIRATLNKSLSLLRVEGRSMYKWYLVGRTMSYFCSNSFLFQCKFEKYPNLWQNYWLSMTHTHAHHAYCGIPTTPTSHFQRSAHTQTQIDLKIAEIISTLTCNIHFALARFVYHCSGCCRNKQRRLQLNYSLGSRFYSIFEHIVFIFRQIQLCDCTRVFCASTLRSSAHLYPALKLIHTNLIHVCCVCVNHFVWTWYWWPGT